MLRSLLVDGFRCFAEPCEVLVASSRAEASIFLCVVGANGSGKSSLLSAVLFALGEDPQAPHGACDKQQLLHVIAEGCSQCLVELALFRKEKEETIRVRRTMQRRGRCAGEYAVQVPAETGEWISCSCHEMQAIVQQETGLPLLQSFDGIICRQNSSSLAMQQPATMLAAIEALAGTAPLRSSIVELRARENATATALHALRMRVTALSAELADVQPPFLAFLRRCDRASLALGQGIAAAARVAADLLRPRIATLEKNLCALELIGDSLQRVVRDRLQRRLLPRLVRESSDTFSAAQLASVQERGAVLAVEQHARALATAEECVLETKRGLVAAGRAASRTSARAERLTAAAKQLASVARSAEEALAVARSSVEEQRRELPDGARARLQRRFALQERATVATRCLERERKAAAGAECALAALQSEHSALAMKLAADEQRLAALRELAEHDAGRLAQCQREARDRVDRLRSVAAMCAARCAAASEALCREEELARTLTESLERAQMRARVAASLLHSVNMPASGQQGGSAAKEAQRALGQCAGWVGIVAELFVVRHVALSPAVHAVLGQALQSAVVLASRDCDAALALRRSHLSMPVTAHILDELPAIPPHQDPSHPSPQLLLERLRSGSFAEPLVQCVDCIASAPSRYSGPLKQLAARLLRGWRVAEQADARNHSYSVVTLAGLVFAADGEVRRRHAGARDLCLRSLGHGDDLSAAQHEEARLRRLHRLALDSIDMCQKQCQEAEAAKAEADGAVAAAIGPSAPIAGDRSDETAHLQTSVRDARRLLDQLSTKIRDVENHDATTLVGLAARRERELQRLQLELAELEPEPGLRQRVEQLELLESRCKDAEQDARTKHAALARAETAVERAGERQVTAAAAVRAATAAASDAAASPHLNRLLVSDAEASLVQAQHAALRAAESAKAAAAELQTAREVAARLVELDEKCLVAILASRKAVSDLKRSARMRLQRMLELSGPGPASSEQAFFLDRRCVERSCEDISKFTPEAVRQFRAWLATVFGEKEEDERLDAAGSRGDVLPRGVALPSLEWHRFACSLSEALLLGPPAQPHSVETLSSLESANTVSACHAIIEPVCEQLSALLATENSPDAANSDADGDGDNDSVANELLWASAPAAVGTYLAVSKELSGQRAQEVHVASSLHRIAADRGAMESQRQLQLFDALDRVDGLLGQLHARLLGPSPRAIVWQAASAPDAQLPRRCYLSFPKELAALDAEGVRLFACPDASLRAGAVGGALWREMGQLSGGQQALCGLALQLALRCTFPSPLLLLDEVDAAMDVGAAARVGSLLRQLAVERRQQFVAVSHRPQTFVSAQRLVGIFWDGATRAVTLPVVGGSGLGHIGGASAGSVVVVLEEVEERSSEAGADASATSPPPCRAPSGLARQPSTPEQPPFASTEPAVRSSKKRRRRGQSRASAFHAGQS